MKKIAAVLMAVLLTAGSTAAFAAEQTAPVVGDVNGDGAVDVMDATEIQRWLAETRESIDTKAADVNRDGAVDVQDITLIQRYIAEFIPNFDAWAPKELTLDVSELTLEVGQQHALTTSYTSEDGAVHFSSGNESVATVDENGLVSAVGEGTATITASSDKGTAAQCTVTVNEAVREI
ncbi:MAG: Ig-like domain-containing protein, partial [Ruminococcus sp.]|nr:Ig-like domain-containing protein [Ruminococcus sp.]